MPWHRTGTVAVQNGSKEITGVGTLWATVVNSGDAFALVDSNDNPTGAWYEIEKVNSNTSMTLKQTYAGSTGSNKKYVVFNLVGNMTTPSFAQRLAKFYEQFSDLKDMPTVTPMASRIPIAGSNGKLSPGWLPESTETQPGAVELASTSEAQAGTDKTKAVTPAGALAAMQKYGVGVDTMSAIAQDYDTMLTSGWYYMFYSSPNNPTDANCILRVLAASNGAVAQLVYRLNATSMDTFIRVKQGDTWSPWGRTPNGQRPLIDQLHVTSTADATSATAAPLKSAGGAAVAKDLWVGKSIVQTGVERYSKTYTGSGGANLLHLEAGEPPIMGDIFITELGTDHYLIGKFFKQNNTTLHIINVIDSNVLTLGAKNVQGSQVIDNYTASGNIRMKIIGYKMN